MSNGRPATLAALLGVLLTAAAAHAAVIYVRPYANPGGTGASWETAFRFLHDAIEAAVVGDEVWVAAGTYRPDRGTQDPGGTGDRLATFALRNSLGFEVQLYGGFVGVEDEREQRDPAAHRTILSGDLLGDDEEGGTTADNAYHVVTAHNVSAAATLDGFVVRAGRADGRDLTGFDWHDDGAGLSVIGGRPTIANCVFEDNWAKREGGGLLCDGASTALVIANCAFARNVASLSNGGGANFQNGTSVTLFDCTFVDNHGERGGAVNLDGSSASFDRCTFNGNGGATNGGALRTSGTGALDATDCDFVGNHADATSGGGGAVYAANTTTSHYTRCDFEQNSTLDVGGAVRDTGGSTTFVDCTFTENASQYRGGAYAGTIADPHFSGCTFAANVADARQRPSLTDRTALGGAVYVQQNADPAFTDCTFHGNAAIGVVMSGGVPTTTPASFGGAVATLATYGNPASIHARACDFDTNYAAYGGAVCSTGVTGGINAPQLVECTFRANTADFSGGAVRLRDGNQALIVNVAFLGNSAALGGGLAATELAANLTATNCLFSGNHAIGPAATGGDGGALRIAGPAVITNCTFGGNTATDLGGAAYVNVTNASGDVTFVNSVLWGDAASTAGAELAIAGQAAVNVRYSDVLGGAAGVNDPSARLVWGAGNLVSDPLLADADGLDNVAGTTDDDLRPTANSPVLDAGDNAAVPADVADLDADFDVVEPTPVDLDGAPRFNGSGAPMVVDQGAYERTASNALLGDLNCDGQVDFDDIKPFVKALDGEASYLERFPDCRWLNADCNGDGAVDFDDIKPFVRVLQGG